MSVPWSLRLLPLLACAVGVQACAVNPVPTPGTSTAANVGEDFTGDAGTKGDVTEAAFSDAFTGGGAGSDAAATDLGGDADAGLPEDATLTTGEIVP